MDGYMLDDDEGWVNPNKFEENTKAEYDRQLIALQIERDRIAVIINEHLGVFPAERLIKAINDEE